MSVPQRGTPGTWAWLGFWDGGELAAGTTLAMLPWTEQKAAAALLEEYTGGLHFAVGTGTWYIWDGRCHRKDQTNAISRLAADFGARLRELCSWARGVVWTQCSARQPADAPESKIRIEFDKEWGKGWSAAEKYAAKLESAAGLAGLVRYLEILAGCSDEELTERSPGVLNVANGTLNLSTLELRRHNHYDLLTYCLSTAWDRTAQCPRFMKLLLRMVGGDTEVANYLVKLLGYALLGDNREQKIIFIAGPTGSGKSQLLRIVSEVLEELAHASQPELITVVRHGRNARTENSIRGARLIPITETSSHMSVDEAQLKRLTGEATVSVDQHYAKTDIKTPVTWTIFVATNQMPTLTNFDAAMRRRIIVIPGGPTVPDWEMDTKLAEGILSTERAGVLRVLAEGCARYFREGLGMPPAVLEMTEEYAAEQNTVANFVADTMVIGGWGSGIHQHEAWQLYQEWARGSSRLSRTEFMDHLGKHPGISRATSTRKFMGVSWNQDWATKVS